MGIVQRLVIWSSPGIFVLLWSTGFIGARLGLPGAEPFTFLTLRFVIVLAILGPVAFFTIRKWPAANLLVHSVFVGILLHGAYLGGVFFAIDRGMPAGVSALVVSLQPIITLLLARLFFGEKISPAVFVFFLIGLCGVGLVLGPGVGSSDFNLSSSSLIASGVAVLGISFGTVYQKQFVADIALLPGLIAQYCGATIVLGALAVMSERMVIDWSFEFRFALAWLVIVLSLGAVGLLMFLIRRDSVARVSALFFLVPGFTVIVANVMFGETLATIQIVGLVIASAAVGAVTYQQNRGERSRK